MIAEDIIESVPDAFELLDGPPNAVGFFPGRSTYRLKERSEETNVVGENY